MLRAVFWVSLLLILYTYVGYPIIVYLCSRKKPEHAAPTETAASELPFVTVIIPVHNEERWIRHKIENTLAIDYPRERIQIVVASDGSTDETVNIAREYRARGVDVIHEPERKGKMATLSRSVPDAQGNIIVLTDANALLSPDAVRLLVGHFRDPRVGCVTGKRVCAVTASRASAGESLYWRYETWIKRAESRVHSCLGANGQVWAVRKSLFPPILSISDDFYVPMKILATTGARVIMEPRAKACIPAAATLRQELERKIRTHVALLCCMPYLKGLLNPGTGVMWWEFLSHHVLRLFVPFGMLLCLAIAGLLWEAGVLYRAALLTQAAFYVAALLGGLMHGCGVRLKLLYFPFYFVLANLAVLLAWYRWLSGDHQPAWARTERIVPEAQGAKQAGYWE
jgi:glycosyltransferase involved in cell wall biosynthesis